MKVWSLFVINLFVGNVDVLDNGLARRPPMGWMSWGHYECAVDCENATDKCLNEELILNVADRFYNDGYAEAGYEYIVIDDCWSEKERDENGLLVPDRKRFPRGLKYIADYIHARGLQFGLYTNAAAVTCKRYPGSRGREGPDAAQFAKWHVDYVKMDGCFVGEAGLNDAYIKMGRALNDTGRPMVFSCSWPYYIQFIHNHQPNYPQVAKYCNLWRDYHDVFPVWQSVLQTVRYFQRRHPAVREHHGPGQWFDPDMLLVGTGSLTPGQNRVQMAVFALMSSPLFISCDMSQVSEEERRILLNLNLLAIAQDRRGVPAKPIRIHDSLTLWVKRHEPFKGDSSPAVSVALVNTDPAPARHSLRLGMLKLAPLDTYALLDVFQEKMLHNVTKLDTLDFDVPGEDVVLYSLFAL